MKSAYMICVLLGITIGSLVLADVKQSSSEGKNATNLEPSKFTVKPSSEGKTDNETTTATPIPTTTHPKTTSTTTSPTTTSSSTTTPTPTTSKSTTTSTVTTVSPPTSTNATTTVTSSTPVPTTTTAVRTTAEPPSTPSPSKDRHFDGLSFFGGIILATCLMAIAAFSWKFYRQCNERNYRTL